MNTSENYLQNNRNSSNNKNQVELTKEQIKDNILTILQKESLIPYLEFKKIENLNDVLIYISKLRKEKKIDDKKYIEILAKSWWLKIWRYLVLKGYIKENDVNEAIDKQKLLKNWENKYKTLWEILLEDWKITQKQLIEATEILWIEKLWEYLISIWLLKDYDELNYYLNLHKYSNKKFWKFLVEKWIINDIQLSKALKQLWTEMWLNDFSIDSDEYAMDKQRWIEHIFIKE